MTQPHRIDARTAEFAKVVGSRQDIALLQSHVREVIEGAAFKGSHRSGQFLQYIVDQAIAGHFDSLKERVIGVELFGRSPTYDTGDDAIVRVTASDVRKRLLQHYGRYGATSEFRIKLPSGSYIPDITRDTLPEAFKEPVPEAHAPDSHEPPLIDEPALSADSAATPPTETVASAAQTGVRRWQLVSLALAVVALLGLLWSRSLARPRQAAILPWSAIFRSPHALQLITSDPDIAEIQGFSGQTLSLSDYANHNYLPDPAKLTAEMRQLCQVLLRGHNAAQVDTPIVASVAQLAQANAKQIEVHSARNLQLENLQTDDNFIFLGSPRSNPWTYFFNDQLNFRFFYDPATGQEIVRNLHPQGNEQAQYVPNALGWATGQSYAVVAFVRNPNQSGQVLLLGGANAEGTEAAARLATDLPRLSTALKHCGIQPSGQLLYFEMLLRLNVMAGSAINANVEACHVLTGNVVR